MLRVRFLVQVSGHVWDDRRLSSATRLCGRHPSRCSAPLVFALRVACVCACVLVRLSHPRPPDRSQHGCTVGVLPGPTRVLPMPRQYGIGRRAPTRAVLSCAASWCVVVRRVHGLWNMPSVRFVLCPLAEKKKKPTDKEKRKKLSSKREDQKPTEEDFFFWDEREMRSESRCQVRPLSGVDECHVLKGREVPLRVGAKTERQTPRRVRHSASDRTPRELRVVERVDGILERVDRIETTCVLGLEPMCVCAPLGVRVLSTLFCVWGAVSGSVTRQRPVRPRRSHANYSQVVTSGGRSGRWWTRFERRLRTSSLSRRTRVARHCVLCCACFVRETTCVLGLEPMCVCAPLGVRVLSTLFCVWGAVSGSVTRQRPVRPRRLP